MKKNTETERRTSQVQDATHEAEPEKGVDEMVMPSVSLLAGLLRPFAIFWLFGHVLSMFFSFKGKLLIQVAIIIAVGIVFIASEFIIDRTLEKAKKTLPDWAVTTIRTTLCSEALAALGFSKHAAHKDGKD